MGVFKIMRLRCLLVVNKQILCFVEYNFSLFLYQRIGVESELLGKATRLVR